MLFTIYHTAPCYRMPVNIHPDASSGLGRWSREKNREEIEGKKRNKEVENAERKIVPMVKSITGELIFNMGSAWDRCKNTGKNRDETDHDFGA